MLTVLTICLHTISIDSLSVCVCVFQADEQEEVKCRYDWHQTASNVVIAIYAKMYHYEKSFIKINPVRLNVCLVFPQQNNAEFKLDLELRGVSMKQKKTKTIPLSI